MEYLQVNLVLIVLYATIIWGIIGPVYKIDGRGKRKIFIIITFLQILFYYTYTSLFSDLIAYGVSFFEIENVSLFNAFSLDLHAGNIEPGYRLLMWGVSYITGSYRLLLAINGLIILVCYYKSFCKYSPYFAISVILFLLIVFNSSIYILRQHLSMAILLLSFPYIISGSLKKYLVICLLAMMLHYSALFFLPTYFLYNIKKLKIFIWITIIGSVCMVLSVKVMMLVLSSYIERYTKYVDETNQYFGGMNYTYAAIFGFVLLAYLFFLKKHVFDDGINKVIFSLLCIGTGAAISFAGTPVPNRALFCYYIAAIWAIPLSMKHSRYRLVRYLLFVSAFMLYYYIAFVSEIGTLEEYYLDFG